MWSSGSIDLENVDLVLDQPPMLEAPPQFRPSPYTFTKLESGKKQTTDATYVSPPSWLLLDHTIAVIWSMFNMDPSLQPLSIDDLKWAYEFLKIIKNQKGENPPDVKVCLKEIEDRLINLYAKSFKTEDLKDIDAAFEEKIIEDSTTSYINTAYFTENVESNIEEVSLSSAKDELAVVQSESSKDVTEKEPEKKEESEKEIPSETFPLLEEDSDLCEGEETGDDEEVEKYVLSLFEGEKKEEAMQAKTNTKSLIPMAKKTPPPPHPEVVAREDATISVTKKEKKVSKRVHCIAQMRSLQFQKSMKVKHTTGEQAAYSKLKAEILTINPNTSKEGVMKILKEWRSEKVDRVHKEDKQVSTIEEYMKRLNHEAKPTFQVNSEVKESIAVKGSRTRRVSS